ncbi:hypothetical protein [Azotobacter salinestris]|uniref:hypothetical protein n=1 Tax=Azotobacter salinestris TaxID=69964 RepID=UPI0032E00330
MWFDSVRIHFHERGLLAFRALPASGFLQVVKPATIGCDNLSPGRPAGPYFVPFDEHIARSESMMAKKCYHSAKIS